MARILAVGAHPDDIELGCGGTLLRHSEAGDKLTLVVASEGGMGGDPAIRLAEQHRSARQLRADLIMLGRPDCNFGEGLETELSAIVDKTTPDIVYSHCANEVHQDHRAMHAAVIAAARNITSLLLFESPRSPIPADGVFVDISETIDEKLQLIACHTSQLARSPLVREELVRARCAIHGARVGVSFAERFDVVRLVK